MLLQLPKYSLNVVYVKDKHLYVVDSLSRNYQNVTEPMTDKDAPLCIKKNMADCIPRTSETLIELKLETENDEELQMLKKTIQNGWPDTIGQVHPKIKQYWTVGEELTAEDQFIFKSNRLIIHQTIIHVLKKMYTSITPRHCKKQMSCKRCGILTRNDQTNQTALDAY